MKATSDGIDIASIAGERSYRGKPASYFSGARSDFVNVLPNNPTARILEIGCGDGAMGRRLLAEGKCGAYYGVELVTEAADTARRHFHEVIQGDVERIDLPWQPAYFDALIMSEVLEHLVDPTAVLGKVRGLLKPGGVVLAGSPNVAHYGIILMLLRGEWQLTDCGVMDRTHLRWFTPRSFRRLFEEAGFTVDAVNEIGNGGVKARVASALLCGQCSWLFARQISITARRAR